MPDNDPLWYKDAIIYEVHVRAFQDSDGDGVGDFRGLVGRLDYLQDLGVTAIWLLPFYPSPLKDDGYDIADYTDIHPSYGTLDDFRAFLDEAHRRCLRVITELVLNHTSDQHPWFRRARRSPPGSPERDFYVWDDEPGQGGVPGRYREARVIFQDFEASNWSWDPVARAYFWHRFFSHQPDLNYDNPAVREAILPVIDFWLGLGVDGLRLDAVPYLFERDGTGCENLPETYEFLKRLRRHVDEHFAGRMLLAEANQWPEDAARYFGAGDACHMAFHFPLMPRMFMAVQMEDRFPILDILDQTPPIAEGCQWALFLRNHDELTLEMVADEERDYMTRAYAREEQARINLGIRRRLAPLMGNSRRKIELMNGLLFSLPGTPVIYYGDEFGMGDNIYLGDRDGVRTPMQWGPGRNAGFSGANAQGLYLPLVIDPEYHHASINVETQEANPHSLLWWTKRLIALRKRSRAFGRGSLELLHPENPKILAFLRRHGDERILVVANLSRFVQHVELDLGALRGLVPVELFGRVEFPPIGERPYPLTLGPHAFYWLGLEARTAPAVGAAPADRGDELPTIAVDGRWEAALAAPARAALEAALLAYLARQPFGADPRNARRAELGEVVRVPGTSPSAYLTLIRVETFEGEPVTYLVPLAFAPGAEAGRVLGERPGSAVARLRASEDGLLVDPLGDPDFDSALLATIVEGRTLPGEWGEVRARTLSALEAADPAPRSRLIQEGQRNRAVAFGERHLLKLFRRIDEGINPEVELGRFLTARAFPHVPPTLGALEYRRGRGEATTLAVLQGYVPNQGDAWQLTLDALGRYYEQALSRSPGPEADPVPRRTLLDLAEVTPPPLASEMIGAFLESARLIGRRTAEFHVALASEPEDPAFAPEPLTALDQRSIYQSLRGRAGRVLRLLARRRGEVPEAARPEVDAVLGGRERILGRLGAALSRRIAATRIRCHGDYHLGQLLATGKDFVIIDAEGIPFRHVSERRHKRSPLWDVAGLLGSFHYASHALWSGQTSGRRGSAWVIRREDVPRLEPWTRLWVEWVGAAFLGAYLDAAAGSSFLPRAREELAILLDVLQLHAMVDGLGYELEHRPDWIWIPLRGILRLLESENRR